MLMLCRDECSFDFNPSVKQVKRKKVKKRRRFPEREGARASTSLIVESTRRLLSLHWLCKVEVAVGRVGGLAEKKTSREIGTC